MKKREAEYLQLKETHDQAINNLKAAIESENLEKEAIQKRLQQELDRSNEQYQERLDMLETKKRKRNSGIEIPGDNLSKSGAGFKAGD